MTPHLPMQTATLGSQALRYIEGGASDAPRTLLLFNGIGASVETMAKFIGGFEHTRVIAFDAPGVGESPAPALPYRMRNGARLAARLLDHLGVTVADVFGVSWGGAENIVHLVLARATGAPDGVKGISLFVVPKFMVKADGSLGARNDVQCVSIEHKLGIKASPTAVLQFGDGGGAVGHLVGQENRGLEYMFIMMNAARYAVGVQGIAIAERAYQLAMAYAKDRVQGRPVDGSLPGAGAIIHRGGGL